MTVCYREARPPCDTPPPFYVTVVAGPGLNPDEGHRALPTQFLVLQLRSTARFDKAGFDDLWQHAKDVLGDELLQSNELSVAPGATVTAGFPRAPQATMVAVIGVFRERAGEAWRALAPLPGVAADKCSTQPVPLKRRPAPGDIELRFEADGVRVENHTPPPIVHSGCG